MGRRIRFGRGVELDAGLGIRRRLELGSAVWRPRRGRADVFAEHRFGAAEW